MFNVLSMNPGPLPKMMDISPNGDGHYSFKGRMMTSVFGGASANYLLWLKRSQEISPVSGLLLLAKGRHDEHWIANRSRVLEADIASMIRRESLVEPKQILFVRELDVYNPYRNAENRTKAVAHFVCRNLSNMELQKLHANTSELAGILHELEAIKVISQANIYVKTFLGEIPLKKTEQPSRDIGKRKGPFNKESEKDENPNADLIRQFQRYY